MAAAESLAGNLIVHAKGFWQAASLLAFLALAAVFAAPAAAELQPPNAALNSTYAMLRWINAYRGRPEPDALPVLVHGLSDLRAFKDAETCGAYVGFIAGVLGANPDRADALIAEMLTISSDIAATTSSKRGSSFTPKT